MTILELLNWSTTYLRQHDIENPRLSAELLLARSLNLSREGLYIHLQDPSGEEEKENFEQLIKKRLSGEPLQYLLGHQEFWSIDFKVDPRVLIPRPETELLVEQSLSILSKNFPRRTLYVLDIGTGSGAIAISLAKEKRDLFVVATDISGEALLLARENAKSAGVLHRIEFVKGDLFSPIRLMREKEPFDLILSNPPYIHHSQIQNLAREVKDHEPVVALNGGEDGMEFYRSIVSQGPSYMRKGGWLLLEVGENQGEKVSGLIEREGSFSRPERIKDLSGIERVVKARRKDD
jgi:release factor glutamine methyltransferase